MSSVTRQSSMSQSNTDMDQMCERVGDLVTAFTSRVQQALQYRLTPMDPDGTTSHRLEHLTDQMMDLVNVATDIEEHLAQIMVLRQFLDVKWTELEAATLERYSRTEAHRYMPTNAKLARIIEENKALWETLRHATEAVEVGKRAVERLTRMEKAASRAAGILMGPA